LTDEDKTKLFGRFQRLSAQPTGKESSTGLGLSIVKKIVELHGGHVWAESVLGEGTTFIAEFDALVEAPRETVGVEADARPMMEA
jgi:signal transduction histidine kinase